MPDPLTLVDGYWRRPGLSVSAFSSWNPGALAASDFSYTPPGGAIYVATDGDDDTGDGSVSTPFASLGHAHEQSSPGDTIVMRGGSYHEDVQLWTQNLTVQNYPGEEVWLDGSVVVTGWTTDTTTVPGMTLYRKDDWVVTTDRSTSETVGDTGTSWINPLYPYASWSDLVTFDGELLTQIGTSLADLGPGKFAVTNSSGNLSNAGTSFTSSKLWLYDNPSGHEVRGATLNKALTFDGSTGITLRGINIRRYANNIPVAAVRVARDDVTFENVRIEQNAHDGLRVISDDVTLTRVTCRDNGAMGMAAWTAHNLTATECLFTGSNQRVLKTTPTTGNVKMTVSNNPTFHRCEFSDGVNAPGLWFDMSVTNIDVVSCKFLNNGWIGCFFELSAYINCVDCVAMGNTSVYVSAEAAEGGSGIQFLNSDFADVWNCTIVDNGSGGNLRIGLDARRDATYPTYIPSDYVIRNCVMSDPTGNNWTQIRVQVQAGDPYEWDTDFGIDLDSNFYHRTVTDEPPTTMYLAKDTGIHQYYTYGDLASFRSAYPTQEQNGYEIEGSAALAANGTILSAYASTLHATATGLTSGIAALIDDRTTGDKRMGSWLV